MWFPTMLQDSCLRIRARCGQSLLVLLGLLLLSGCGGGSGTTDEGFRFVPEGSGAVIPNPNVHFEYSAGSVTSGVIVTAAPVTAGPTTAPNSTAVPQPSAYQVSFSTPEVTFSPQARIYLTYTPTTTPSSVPRVYLYSPVADAPNKIVAGWQALVLSTVAPAPGANTLEALLPPVVESGSILAVYADTPPLSTGVPTTVTGP